MVCPTELSEETIKAAIIKSFIEVLSNGTYIQEIDSFVKVMSNGAGDQCANQSCCNYIAKTLKLCRGWNGIEMGCGNMRLATTLSIMTGGWILATEVNHHLEALMQRFEVLNKILAFYTHS